MPLSGKALLQRVMLITHVTMREGDELKDLIWNRQNTHRNETEESVFNSTEQLYELYKERLLQDEKMISGEIDDYVAQLTPSERAQAEPAIDRVFKLLNFPYAKLAAAKSIKLSAKEALLLAWLGAVDTKALKEQVLSPNDIEQRKYSLINTLIKTYNEYGPKHPACYGGTFHALIGSLSGIHQCALVVLDKRQAYPLARESVKSHASVFFNEWVTNGITLSDQEDVKQQQLMTIASKKEAIYKGLAEEALESKTMLDYQNQDDTTNPLIDSVTETAPINPTKEAQKFIIAAKAHVLRILKLEYHKILKDHELEEQVEALDYLDKVDLVAPTLKSSIISQTKSCLAALPLETQYEIAAVWHKETQESEDIQSFLFHKVCDHIENKYHGSLSNADLKFILNDIRFMKIHDLVSTKILDSLHFDDSISHKSTTEEDAALKNHSWLARPWTNTLMMAAEHYGPLQGYLYFLQDLLNMVSVEALATAVLEVDTRKTNALMMAAEYQNSGGFSALIKRLATTKVGQDALLKAVLQVDSKGQHAIMLAARHQTTGGFIDLLENLAISDRGQQTLVDAMPQINSDKRTTLNLASQYQTQGGFTKLITMLYATDLGKKALLNDSTLIDNTYSTPFRTTLTLATTFQTNANAGYTVYIQQLSDLHALVPAMHSEYDEIKSAAKFQRNGGFRVLIERLLATMSGQIRIMKSHNSNLAIKVKQFQSPETALYYQEHIAMLTLNPASPLQNQANTLQSQGILEQKPSIPDVNIILNHGYNELLPAAMYLKDGQFSLLVERLGATESGQNTLIIASTSVDTWNNKYFLSDVSALFVAASCQSHGGFLSLIKQIATTELGYAALCKGLQLSDKESGANVLMLAARTQPDHVFSYLISLLTQKEMGQKALFEALSKETRKPFAKYSYDIKDHKSNALLIAAAHQTHGGFTALIDALMASTSGKKLLFEIIPKRNIHYEERADTLMNAASHQTQGGFTHLIRHLTASIDGQKVLFAATTSIGGYYKKNNVIPIAAKNQITDGFIELVNFFFTTESRKKIFIEGMQYTHRFYEYHTTILAVATYQKEQHFAFLVEKLSESASGKNVMISALRGIALDGLTHAHSFDHRDKQFILLLKSYMATKLGQEVVSAALIPMDVTNNKILLYALKHLDKDDLKYFLDMLKTLQLSLNPDVLKKTLGTNHRITQAQIDALVKLSTTESTHSPTLFNHKETLINTSNTPSEMKEPLKPKKI